MKVTFWGTRGSLPAAYRSEDIRRKLARALEAAQGKDLSNSQAIDRFIREELPVDVAHVVGCNTSCVEIESRAGTRILCDAGSGLRDFIHRLPAATAQAPGDYHFFMSHPHWDHIQGFPFFGPAYRAGNRIIIHSCHPGIEPALRAQADGRSFPIPYDQLKAEIIFDIQPVDHVWQIGDITVRAIEQNHPGKSYGYRFEADGQAVVYSTDSEHHASVMSQESPFFAFFSEADLLIFDAMYTLADATVAKANWGHSSNVLGVDMASRAKVKTLALFHHEPTNTDEALAGFLQATRTYAQIHFEESGCVKDSDRFPHRIILATDGLVWEG